MADDQTSADVERARRIDQMCDRFEQNWRLGRRHNLQSYLASMDPQDREAAFKAIFELELDLRRKAGESPALQEYLDLFPMYEGIVRAVHAVGHSPEPVVAKRSTMDSQSEQTGNGSPEQVQVREFLPPQFGRYQVKSQIGAGGMGAVMLAEDTLLGRSVALKVPYLNGTDQKEQLERFVREARTAAILRHPNICPIYDVGEVNGIRYISMAYIDGLPLSKHMVENPLSESQIAWLIWKLAGALQDAHENGVVHRDLKPANIIIDRKGEPIVMDFGLALHMQFETDVRLTQTGMQMGSPAYMSPEQVDGDRKRIGPAADIYSLGVVLYELLTGRIPFAGPTASIFVQIIMKEPVRPSIHRAGLSPELEAICLKMMAKRIEDRYASMTDVADAMQEFGNQQVAMKFANRAQGSTAVEAEKPATTGTQTGDGKLSMLAAAKESATILYQEAELRSQQMVDEEAELRLLLFDIGNALRDHKTQGLLEKVERYLKFQPDNPAMCRLRTKLQSERDRPLEMADLVDSWNQQTTERHAGWKLDLDAILPERLSVNRLASALRTSITAVKGLLTGATRRVVEGARQSLKQPLEPAPLEQPAAEDATSSNAEPQPMSPSPETNSARPAE